MCRLLELTGRICYPFFWLVFWCMYQIIVLPLKLIWHICWFGCQFMMFTGRFLWTCLVHLMRGSNAQRRTRR